MGYVRRYKIYAYIKKVETNTIEELTERYFMHIQEIAFNLYNSRPIKSISKLLLDYSYDLKSLMERYRNIKDSEYSSNFISIKGINRARKKINEERNIFNKLLDILPRFKFFNYYEYCKMDKFLEENLYENYGDYFKEFKEVIRERINKENCSLSYLHNINWVEEELDSIINYNEKFKCNLIDKELIIITKNLKSSYIEKREKLKKEFSKLKEYILNHKPFKDVILTLNTLGYDITLFYKENEIELNNFIYDKKIKTSMDLEVDYNSILIESEKLSKYKVK